MVDAKAKTRSHREFDHTGDLGIEVEAESLAGILEEAAIGMFGLLTDLSDVSSVEEYRVSVSGDDEQNLLLNWLSELNFMHLTERIVPARFTIDTLDELHAEATVGGEPVDPERHKIYTEIKAVTYHGMVVEERRDRWFARVIFDV